MNRRLAEGLDYCSLACVMKSKARQSRACALTTMDCRASLAMTVKKPNHVGPADIRHRAAEGYRSVIARPKAVAIHR